MRIDRMRPLIRQHGTPPAFPPFGFLHCFDTILPLTCTRICVHRASSRILLLVCSNAPCSDERKTLALDTEMVGLLRSRALDCYSPMTGKVSKTLPPHVQPAFVDTQNIGCLISSPNLMSVYPTSLR